MEWSKAKTILLVLLILLNLFLLIGILLHGANFTLSDDYVQYAKKFLAERNITFKADPPSYNKASGMIEYKSRQINEDQVVKAVFGKAMKPVEQENGKRIWDEGNKILEIGNNSIRIRDFLPGIQESFDNPDELTGSLQAYIKRLGVVKNELVLESQVSIDAETREISFVEKYKEQLLFDNAITIQVSRDGRADLELICRDVNKVIGSDEILSVYQILVMAGIPEHSVISSIDFGYKRINEEDLFDSPVWRIRFDNGKIDYYNAYTGDIFVK